MTMTTTFPLDGVSATYSAEDNKLRIYSPERFDSEVYAILKDNGFKWAPKQKLFVAPRWTPYREDVCLKLAGEITAEESTMVERAQAKAQRLEDIAVKRAAQSNQYADSARRISERFADGQPILVGHHSERKARKDQDAMERAKEKSAEAAAAVDYWNYRAEGVERHANRKSNPVTRKKRIKTLLAELRDNQRTINDQYKKLKLWEKADAMEDGEEFNKMIEALAGAFHYRVSDDHYRKLKDGDIKHREVCTVALEKVRKINNSKYYHRWICHILNRLAFEQSELSEVSRYEGDLTPVIIQAFAREHGAEKPKSSKTTSGYILNSPVPLPVHVGDGKELELNENEWRDLMQACGYEVIAKERRAPKKQTCSLINPTPEDAAKLQELWNIQSLKSKYGKSSELEEMPQSYYSARSGGDYAPLNTITLDENGLRIWGSYRQSDKDKIKTCRVRARGSANGMYSADAVLIITDKPQKPLPYDLDALLRAAKGEETPEAVETENGQLDMVGGL